MVKRRSLDAPMCYQSETTTFPRQPGIPCLFCRTVATGIVRNRLVERKRCRCSQLQSGPRKYRGRLAPGRSLSDTSAPAPTRTSCACLAAVNTSEITKSSLPWPRVSKAPTVAARCSCWTIKFDKQFAEVKFWNFLVVTWMAQGMQLLLMLGNHLWLLLR